jgi:hypothetical protein
MRLVSVLSFVAALLFAAFIHSIPAAALTPEEATRVGGEKGIEFASGAITVQTAGGPPVPAELAAGAAGAASAGAEKATP